MENIYLQGILQFILCPTKENCESKRLLSQNKSKSKVDGITIKLPGC